MHSEVRLREKDEKDKHPDAREMAYPDGRALWRKAGRGGGGGTEENGGCPSEASSAVPVPPQP